MNKNIYKIRNDNLDSNITIQKQAQDLKMKTRLS